tara:strand:+ start:65 stop:724 length:660 start_codon:yes stop_codon:yes gene_type:complete
MATIAERIKSYTSLDVTGDEELLVFLNAWLNDAITEVSLYIPPNAIHMMAENKYITNEYGVEIESSNILSATREYNQIEYPCREIHPRFAGRAKDDKSMYFATSYDPVFYKSNRKVYVLPEPTAIDKATIEYFAPITATLEDVGISNFPNELESAVVVNTSIKVLEYLFAQEEDEELYPPMITILKQDYVNLLSSYLRSMGVETPQQPPQRQQQEMGGE